MCFSAQVGVEGLKETGKFSEPSQVLQYKLRKLKVRLHFYDFNRRKTQVVVIVVLCVSSLNKQHESRFQN